VDHLSGRTITPRAPGARSVPLNLHGDEMVLFADLKAYERLRGGVGPDAGIRWFREAGAWVERPRPRPAALPVLPTQPAPRPARSRWISND